MAFEDEMLDFLRIRKNELEGADHPYVSPADKIRIVASLLNVVERASHSGNLELLVALLVQDGNRMGKDLWAIAHAMDMHPEMTKDILFEVDDDG